MKQKHTEGPWFIRPPQSNFQKGKYTIHPATSYAAHMADHEKLIATVGGAKIPSMETDKNAYLIAAAPKMFQYLTALFDEEGNFYIPNPADIENIKHVLVAAGHSFVKATPANEG